MKTSIKIGELFDIPVRLHLTLLLVIGFIAWSIGSQVFQIAELIGIDPTTLGEGIQSYILGIIIAVGLFISVFAHEMAHSLMARSIGIKIEEITLWIFGGVSNMEEIPHEPKLEIKISIVGPLTSLLIGSVLYIISFLGFNEAFIFVFRYLGIINIILAIFNLLPAFPMDGGRILRAIFARNNPYVTATKRAAEIGKAFAVALGIFGIFANPFLIIIALFVFIGASQESQTVMLREVLQNVKVKEIMTKDVKTVSPDMKIEDFLNYVFKVQHTGFPVVDKGKILGIITMKDARKIESHRVHEFSVKDVMEKEVIDFSPNDNVSDLWQKMMEKNIGRFPIIDEDELVGIVTRSDVMHSFEALKEIETYKGDEI